MRTYFATDCFVEPCCRAPTLRPNRADMSRGAFVALLGAWSGVLGGLLVASMLVRLFG